MSDPLSAIVQWYDVALDSMRVTRRVVRARPDRVVTDRHVFFGEPLEAVEAMLNEAEAELSDLIVLAFVAAFERALRDHILATPRLASPAANPVDGALRGQIRDDAEYWRLSGTLLDLFGDRVSENLRGLARQFIEYRDWVAHGRPQARPPSANVTPQFAYQRLADFLRDAGIV